MGEKRVLIELESPRLSVLRQCELLALPRSTLYYKPAVVSQETLMLGRLLDEIYTEHPYYGVRRMTAQLIRMGHKVGLSRVRGLLAHLSLSATYPKPNLSKRDKQHPIYPYLLRGLKIEENDHVWSTDITYIRLPGGFVYLVAIIDWGSRFVLDWQLSPTLEADFCIETLKRTLENNKPKIFNTDQGSQFTSPRFTEVLRDKDILISMDGRGRALDNVFVERLWRSLKQEKVYICEFRTVREAKLGIDEYFDFYNHRRVHQSLGYRTPAEVYRA